MSEGESTAPRDRGRAWRRPQGDLAAARELDSARCATELLAIVAYVTANDGPLQASPDPAGTVSPWHRRLLLKASERLDVIDAFMRARVAFLVAGRERGYYAPAQELALAGAALDNCRSTTAVVDALLSGRLPTENEYDAMGRTALALNPSMNALRQFQEAQGDD
jgi:hypothetical protein